MKVNKLQQGDRFKSYKQLCETLEMKVTNGRSKTLQLKELERFVKYHKDGNSFIIDEIYPTPVEKTDLRKKGNNNKFASNIEVILLYLLNNVEGCEIMCSTTRLLKLCNLINDNYVNGRHSTEDIAKMLDMDNRHVNYFYGSTYSELKRTVELALRKMERSFLLTYNTDTIVCIEAIDGETGKPFFEHRVATAEEVSVILKIERETMLELDCSSISDIHIKGKRKIFYQKVNKKLRRLTPFSFHYHVYRLVLNKHGIAQEVEGYEYSLLIINNNAKDKISKKIHNSKGKVIKHGWGRTTHIEQEENFIENQLKLVDMLIDSQAPVIRVSR